MDFGRLRPSFWYQQRPTSAVWDWALNYALDTYGIRSVGPHEAEVGPFTVWIANYPYAFGYDRTDALEHIPFVRTRIKLKKAISAFHDRRYTKMLETPPEP